MGKGNKNVLRRKGLGWNSTKFKNKIKIVKQN
jgi:hypothetical protein